MDQYNVKNNFFIPQNYQREKISETSASFLRHKNFLNGLQNAQNLLNGLERCLQKSSKYEKKLLRCKSSHSHTHNFNDWWESEPSVEKETKTSNTGNTKSSRSQVDLAESWSTMSIVCLQYQYEELSKRYETLLQAYDERCRKLNESDKTIERLQRRTYATHAQLVRANKTLLSVGEKYLILRRKRLLQKKLYEEKLEVLKHIIQEITAEVDQKDLELDRLNINVEPELEVNTALLMSEIRKCNYLFLENLHLKELIRNETSQNDTLETY
ncbi:unnamed protein product [Parnassius mnemosyne]|uniref:Uncharacterized protein n=1 Tax=Parnassius mnemosyne TaxID=213953 RepID=A0AAV1KUX8_9NEOP